MKNILYSADYNFNSSLVIFLETDGIVELHISNVSHNSYFPEDVFNLRSIENIEAGVLSGR